MVLLEVFAQGHNGNTMGTFQASRGDSFRFEQRQSCPGCRRERGSLNNLGFRWSD